MLPLRMLRVRLVQKAHADVILASGISSSVGERALNKLTLDCQNCQQPSLTDGLTDLR